MAHEDVLLDFGSACGSVTPSRFCARLSGCAELRGKPVRRRRCPRNCERRAEGPSGVTGVRPGKAGPEAVTREPGDLPRQITSSGGVSGQVA